MTIADKLALLEQTKEAQRVKLGLPESMPFSQYIKFMQAWTPIELFKNGEQGVWFDPSDLSTMFQDVDGTEPVTKDGDPVALIRDKSGNNNHATQDAASARPIYRTDGNLHWLEFDGVDDELVVNGLPWKEDDFWSATAVKRLTGRFGLPWIYKGDWSLLEDYGNPARLTERRMYQRYPNAKQTYRNSATAYPSAQDIDIYTSLNSKGGGLRIKTISSNNFTHADQSNGLVSGLAYDGVSISLGQYLSGSFSNMRIYAYVHRNKPVSNDIGVVAQGYMANKAGLLL